VSSCGAVRRGGGERCFNPSPMEGVPFKMDLEWNKLNSFLKRIDFYSLFKLHF
jgi:hypothetical protein